MGKAIGIDLGERHAVAAVCTTEGRVLDSKDGRPQLASMVGLKKRRGKRVGEDPKTLSSLHADNRLPIAMTGSGPTNRHLQPMR